MDSTKQNKTHFNDKFFNYFAYDIHVTTKGKSEPVVYKQCDKYIEEDQTFKVFRNKEEICSYPLSKVLEVLIEIVKKDKC
jgi:hypothetical protein